MNNVNKPEPNVPDRLDENSPSKGWNIFYQTSSIIILIIGLICLVSGLLSKFGPNFFYTNSAIFPTETFQIFVGIFCLFFYIISKFIYNKFVKILWWLMLVPVILAISLACLTDPLKILTMIGNTTAPRVSESQSQSSKKEADGKIRVEKCITVFEDNRSVVERMFNIDRSEKVKSWAKECTVNIAN